MSEPPQRSQHVLAWVLVAAWAVIVWSLGSDSLSAAQTSRILRPFLEWFFPDLTVRQLYQTLVATRKAAHVIEYGLLAILTLRALLLGKRPSVAACAGLAMVFIVTFAMADETRQGLSLARTGSAWDVVLDSVGGATAIGLLLYLQFRNPKPIISTRDPQGASGTRKGEA